MTSVTTDRPGLRVVPDDEPEPVETPAETPVETPAEAPEDAAPEVPVEEGPEEPEDGPNAVRARDRARARAGGYAAKALTVAGRVIRPPDFWSRDLPSLRASWRHAIWGGHIPPESIARVAYVVVWCVLCLPLASVFAVLRWVHDRPARMGVFYLTLWALWQIPPVRAVIGFVTEWNLPVLYAHMIGIGG